MRFNQDHILFRESVRTFIDREITPFIDQWEDERGFPGHELYKELGDEGYLGLTYPEEYGGLALDFWYTVILMEELGQIGAGGIPMSLTVQTDICTPVIARYGTHQLKERFLTPAIMGDFIGALAITEKGAGSDVSAITTSAREVNDYYIINGNKCYITNGSIADFVVTLCKTSDEGLRGMSLIVVPTETPGFTATTTVYDKKIGNFCCDHAELTYENVKVPKKNVLGMAGQGWDIQMEQFQHERLIEGILACSQAQRILDETKAYAKQRNIFGRRLIDHQSNAFALVNMETEVEFLRQMTYYCADLFISGKECTKEVSMVKMKAGKILRKVADDCLQMFGGRGYLENNSISRLWRDVRANAFTGGSVETMQHILTHYL